LAPDGSARRGKDSICFERAGACGDAGRHRNRPGRRRGEVRLDSAGWPAAAPPRVGCDQGSGLQGRSAKPIRKNKNVLEPILAVIGTVKLRDLDAAAVDTALNTMARDYSTACPDVVGLASSWW
jgi:hypothetical protein